MRSHIFSYSQNLAKNGYFSRVGQMPTAAVPPSSLMAPELRCLTGVPLDMRVPLGGGKWHADRALGTTGWYGVGICAVAKKYRTTRRRRVARPSPADPAPGQEGACGPPGARSPPRRPRLRGCCDDRRRTGHGQRRSWRVIRHLRQGRRRGSTQQPEGASPAYPWK